MSQPQFKITIDGTEYTNDTFIDINVKRRECNYDVATLVANDDSRALYDGGIQKFDVVKIELKANSADAYTQVFGGKVRQVNPNLQHGKYLTVTCKGYGAECEDTHCNRDYGLESSNPTINQIDDIIVDLTDNFVEKSFGGAATNHTITTTKVSDYVDTAVKYINNPYRANIEILDTLGQLSSAIGGGTTAGGHWIVIPDAVSTALLLWAKIGDHAAGNNSPETEWPDWWNTNQAGSTLIEGVDFLDFNVLDKAEEYANNVVLVTDFRHPAYDYYTEGGFDNGLWGKDGTTVEDSAAAPGAVVGSEYLLIEDALAYTPSTEDAGWDVTKWGSHKTIPRLNFYMYKNDLVNANCQIRLFTTDKATDYFYCSLATLDDPDDEWIWKSIPIGPYWATADEIRKFRWLENGSPDWTDINGLAFYAVDNGVDPGSLLLDDLHFTGKIVRSAQHTASIGVYGEIQKVLIARNAMDDSCVASDDTGYAGRIAHAELLRRVVLPKTISFSITGKPTMMAGQKCHVHACKKPAGTFVIDLDMRMLQVEHSFNAQGFTTTVTASSDLKNTLPINQTDVFAMWQENMFLNSNEAKNIRAGAEVDLLVSPLIKTY